MNSFIKKILVTVLLLFSFNAVFSLTGISDSIAEKLVTVGSKKLKKLQLENEEHIKNKEYYKLNFIINLGTNDNLINYEVVLTTGKFIDNLTKEQALNERLKQLYINSNYTKQCYLLLINYFDIEIKLAPPDSLTIEDVFKSNKFFDENSNIIDCKNEHRKISSSIENQSFDKSKHYYFLSLARFRAVFQKDENPKSAYTWFSHFNAPENLATPDYFNETYDYLKTYLISSKDKKYNLRETIVEDFVTAFEQAYKNAPLKAQILSTHTSSGLKLILQNFTTSNDYLTLTSAERVHILKVFTGEIMVTTETYALNVLKNTPTNQQSIILDSLKSVKNEFNDNLISLLSWRMDGENFNGYIETITLWLSIQSANNVSWKQILQNSDRDKRCIIEFSASLLDGYGSTVSYSEENVCFKVTKNFSMPISTTTKCADVYDKVLVKFVSDFDINGRQFKKGDVVLMPSLYANLLFNKSTNDKLKTLGNVALNSALLIVGIGEISAATTYYETTIALLDMGVGASDLIIQEGFATTLNQSQEGKDFLNVWNKINLIWGSTRIVSELTGLNTELKNYAQQLKKNSTLTNTEQQKINEILQEVDEYTGSTLQGLGKTGLLSKISSHTHLSSWVNNLDEVADAALISKLDNLATTNPEKLSQLDDLYNPSKFQMTSGTNRIPVNSPAPFQSTINGKTVNYNSQGFPDFKPHSAGSSFEFKSNSLTGSGSATSGDFLAANNWATSNPALAGKFQTIPGSQKCLVKFGDDWIECTWHHVQDGRTMFPVPSDIHNAFRHTGGKAIIERGLQDIFTY